MADSARRGSDLGAGARLSLRDAGPLLPLPRRRGARALPAGGPDLDRPHPAPLLRRQRRPRGAGPQAGLAGRQPSCRSCGPSCADFDVVYSAHVSPYGAVPATLIESPGTTAPVFVLHPTPEQHALLTASEPNYDLVESGRHRRLSQQARLPPARRLAGGAGGGALGGTDAAGSSTSPRSSSSSAPTSSRISASSSSSAPPSPAAEGRFHLCPPCSGEKGGNDSGRCA